MPWKNSQSALFIVLALTACDQIGPTYVMESRDPIGWVTDSFTQSQYTDRYDFLWVVDNSGSMTDIRVFMAQNLSSFSQILEARRDLDWQMAVTNTDFATTQGNLIAAPGGIRVVRRDMPSVSTVWASLIASIVSTPRSGWEQGLESGRAAIENHGNEFTRPGVPLVVGYITDEQDYSCANGCSSYYAPESNPSAWGAFPISRYVDHFAEVKARLGADVIVYPITNLEQPGNGSQCDDPQGSKGQRYLEVRAAVGTGEDMSLCRDTLTESFAKVAALTAKRGVCFDLNKPLAKIDGMKVLVDGAPISPSATNGYLYEPIQNAVCFNGSLIPQNGAIIEVTYLAP